MAKRIKNKENRFDKQRRKVETERQKQALKKQRLEVAMQKAENVKKGTRLSIRILWIVLGAALIVLLIFAFVRLGQAISSDIGPVIKSIFGK